MSRQLVAAGLLLLAALPAAAIDYVQTSGSTLGFSGIWQGERFEGRFPGFATRLAFDPAKPSAARLDVEIRIAAATAGTPEEDLELRGKAFLDAARHPAARYVARGFRATGPGRYTAVGTLSLRGVTRPVTFNFRWTPGAKPLLVGTAMVKRLQFGVGAGEWADVGVLGNDIAVHARVVLTPVAASAKKRP